MSEETLVLKVEYDYEKKEFNVSGNVKEHLQEEFISDFLRTQIGAGEDKRKANKLEKYFIEIKRNWRDNFTVCSNTGNDSLRDGILMHYLDKKYN